MILFLDYLKFMAIYFTNEFQSLSPKEFITTGVLGDVVYIMYDHSVNTEMLRSYLGSRGYKYYILDSEQVITVLIR